MADDQHKVTVEYTWRDNGIWLNCEPCDWWYSAGFSPSVEALAAAAQDHLSSAVSAAQR